MSDQVVIPAHLNFTTPVRLSDGTITGCKDVFGFKDFTPEEQPWLVAAQTLLKSVLAGPPGSYSLVDIGCLEGAHTVEFARAGYRATGIEVRPVNFEHCQFVKADARLENLNFIQDNALNVEQHGPFDIGFCSGLLYHLDTPWEMIETLGRTIRRVLIIQTHFAPSEADFDIGDAKPFGLGPLVTENGYRGRWFREFKDDEDMRLTRDGNQWASWDNMRSFWLTRPEILGLLYSAGFQTVFEQFDSLGPDIPKAMTSGYYRNGLRSTFVGLRPG